MPSQLYVGSLASSVTNDDLEALFSQIGKVASAAVVSDKFSGQSRGFGFVEMESSGDAAKAISEFDGRDLKGRNLKVNEAKISGVALHPLGRQSDCAGQRPL